MSKFKLLVVILLLFSVLSISPVLQAEQDNTVKPIGIVIHGGAGTIMKSKMTAQQEKERRAKLEEALKTGYGILIKGGKSLDAVEATIRILEDSPMFNAGKGAVFTNEGKNELDSSIMDGKTLNAGAVAGVTHIKNPISLARLVMEKSPHVMLSREGAEVFAKKMGIKMVPPDYFHTKLRWDALQRAKEREKKKKKHQTDKYGTVGAAALDSYGNLAAGTSTGGMTNKKWARIGDSPVIGAGTYANNKTCAISATGHGEYFIRAVVAYDISALMQYKGLSLEEASNLVVMKKLKKFGGSGGIIAIDNKGNISAPFNTAGMYRGWVDKNGNVTVKIFSD